MTAQATLFDWTPPPVKFGNEFDGVTFEKPRDGIRLNRQLSAVYEVMKDGEWRTLARISEITGAPMQSVSARIRDLSKPKFLGIPHEKQYVEPVKKNQ
jgi:hypothetical protein